jgi:Skp family chaperone for outer membrane proteins
MRFGTRFGAAVALWLTALWPLGARSQQVAAPVIITVDVQQILRDSLVAKDVQAQMDQRTDRYTKEVTDQENELQRTQEELEKERSTLATDDFNAKMRDFQRRYDTLDNRVQATRQGLQQSYNDAMTKVENTALQIISDIAAERKANLVVAKAAVLFEAPELDITQEVIKRLDVKLPQVQLTTPQIAPNAAVTPPSDAMAPGTAPPIGGTALPQPPH